MSKQHRCFKARALYQLSYLDRIQLCYVNSEIVLITQVLYGVFVRCAGKAGAYMYRGSYMTSP